VSCGVVIDAGSWELNENLAQALSRGLAELVASVPADVSADLWATALALSALDSQFAAEKEVRLPPSLARVVCACGLVCVRSCVLCGADDQ
jgi:hypothetical protein